MTTVNNIATIVIAAIGGGAVANVNDWDMA
jgi:hypothetical protein